MIAGVVLPGVLLVLLMAIPYLDPNPSRRGKDRRVAIISGIVAGVVMIIWSYMGTPQYAALGTPAVEVIQEMMPEEGAGLVREMGYANIPPGTYVVGNPETCPEKYQEEMASEEELENLFHESHHFEELIHEFSASVTKWSADPDFNEEEKLQKHFWVHEDALYWEQYGRKDFSYLSSEEESDAHGAQPFLNQTAEQ